MHITHCSASVVADSRGRPTIAVELKTQQGLVAQASVPSGKSTGAREAKELRDEDGDGVDTAIAQIHEVIAPALVSGNWRDLPALDHALCALDGTQDKRNLGANSVLAVSIAAARLFAQEAGMPLWQYLAKTYGTTPKVPSLYVNMINGGVHADFALPFQEHLMIIDKDAADESYTLACELFDTLGTRFTEKADAYGDEGGYVSQENIALERPFELLSDLAGTDANVFVGIDAAANELYGGGVYELSDESYTEAQLTELYKDLISRFRLRSIEDPFAETQLEAHASLTKEVGDYVDIVGDDLTVTDAATVEKYADAEAANAVIIKPNQVGTVTESVEAAKKAKAYNWHTIVSHRSGETEDAFIADLAYGLGADGLKAGAPTQHVRRVKYERLCEIEGEAIALTEE